MQKTGALQWFLALEEEMWNKKSEFNLTLRYKGGLSGETPRAPTGIKLAPIFSGQNRGRGQRDTLLSTYPFQENLDIPERSDLRHLQGIPFMDTVSAHNSPPKYNSR